MGKLQTITGVIEAKSRNKKGIKIEDEWFNAYKANELDDFDRDDEVEVEYELVEKGGQEFRNIKSISRAGGSSSSRSRSSSSRERSSSSSSERSTGGGSKSLGDDARQRSIVRQNSLTNANALLATYYRGQDINGEPEEFAELLVEIAGILEKYSMLEDK